MFVIKISVGWVIKGIMLPSSRIPTVDGRNPKGPPGIFGNLVNNGILPTSSGERRISEPSTVLTQQYNAGPTWNPFMFPSRQELHRVESELEGRQQDGFGFDIGTPCFPAVFPHTSYVHLGVLSPLPGCQWQVKVYRDSLQKHVRILTGWGWGCAKYRRFHMEYIDMSGLDSNVSVVG